MDMDLKRVGVVVGREQGKRFYRANARVQLEHDQRFVTNSRIERSRTSLKGEVLFYCCCMDGVFR